MLMRERPNPPANARDGTCKLRAETFFVGLAGGKVTLGVAVARGIDGRPVRVAEPLPAC
jgi:hypothetical protein